MSDRVPAESTRTCIGVLRDAGWGWETIARAAGVPVMTVRNIGTGRVRTVDSVVAVRIAALPLAGADSFRAPNAGASARVDPADTLRRLDWLAEQGWSRRWIGVKALGLSDVPRFNNERISRRKALLVERAFEHLVRGVDNGMCCAVCGRELRLHDQAHTKECWHRDGLPFPVPNTPVGPARTSQEDTDIGS